MIITIDGPVATGKSTIAKRLAESLGFIYFDTGAMYRAIAYGVLKNAVDLDDDTALKAFLDDFVFNIKVRHRKKIYCANGEDVTEEIRAQAVTHLVSQVAAKPLVRDKLVAIQRELAVGVNAVFEGRDMGTVVFPDADLKIFLEGGIEIRAQRRLDQLIKERPEEAKDLTLGDMMKEITERDDFDSSREISPLRKAEDAFGVDTSDLSIDEVVFQIFECKDQAKTKHTSPEEEAENRK